VKKRKKATKMVKIMKKALKARKNNLVPEINNTHVKIWNNQSSFFR
jgi:hypothetical protein